MDERGSDRHGRTTAVSGSNPKTAGKRPKIRPSKICTYQAEDWHLYTAAGFHNTADCVYFIHHPDGNGWIKDKDAEFCMVSLNENDRLRLIDCDKETRKGLCCRRWKLSEIPSPLDVKKAIVDARGADQIQKEGEEYGTYEFKLKGHLFSLHFNLKP